MRSLAGSQQIAQDSVLTSAEYLALTIRVTPDDVRSATAQLRDQLRASIATGALPIGSRLPSIRELANALGVDVSVPAAAYRQLSRDGLVGSRGRGGTIVENVPVRDHRPTPGHHVSAYGQSLLRLEPRQADTFALDSALLRCPLPDVEEWTRLLAMHSPEGHAHAGYLRLRRAVASFLWSARGLHCDPEHVVIAPSRERALECILRVLADHGDLILVDHPGGGRAADLAAANAMRVVRRRMHDGLFQLDAGAEVSPRLAFVSPGSQPVLGTRMTAGLRYELLQWAKVLNFSIVEEDDWISLSAAAEGLTLKSLDKRDRVLLTGTFASLLPGVELSFIVAPPWLVDPLTRALRSSEIAGPLPDTVAEAIESGWLFRHTFEMASAHRRVADEMVTVVESLGLDGVSSVTAARGSHVAVRTRTHDQADRIAARAAAAGLPVITLPRPAALERDTFPAALIHACCWCRNLDSRMQELRERAAIDEVSAAVVQ